MGLSCNHPNTFVYFFPIFRALCTSAIYAKLKYYYIKVELKQSDLMRRISKKYCDIYLEYYAYQNKSVNQKKMVF